MDLEPYKPPALAPASYQIKMEDIKQSFVKIDEMLQSVVSKMAAASQPGKSQCLPVIAEILNKMEMIVSIQVSSAQSESGYDTSSSPINNVTKPETDSKEGAKLEKIQEITENIQQIQLKWYTFGILVYFHIPSLNI